MPLTPALWGEKGQVIGVYWMPVTLKFNKRPYLMGQGYRAEHLTSFFDLRALTGSEPAHTCIHRPHTSMVACTCDPSTKMLGPGTQLSQSVSYRFNESSCLKKKKM